MTEVDSDQRGLSHELRPAGNPGNGAGSFRAYPMGRWVVPLGEHSYNTAGLPIAAGVLYPFFGLLLSPIIAAAAMSFSSVSVVSNALRLRRANV